MSVVRIVSVAVAVAVSVKLEYRVVGTVVGTKLVLVVGMSCAIVSGVQNAIDGDSWIRSAEHMQTIMLAMV
jgi:hypothetical protein